MYYKIEIIDAIIKDPSDPLYELQQKYNVKISRSNQSDAVYIFRKRAHYLLRIGHPISRNQSHLKNFDENIPIKGKVTKDIIEEEIKRRLSKF